MRHKIVFVTNRRLRRAVACLTATVFLAGASCSSQTSDDITANGSVDSEVITVSVPAIPAPVVDLDAGFAESADAPSAQSAQASTASASELARVAAVNVSVGQQISQDDVIASMDDAAFTADLAAAEAAHSSANAQVGALRQAKSDLADQLASLRQARRGIDQALATIATQRAQAQTRLSAARQQLASLPTDPPAGTPAAQTRTRLQAAVTQLTTALAQLDAGLATARTQRAQLDTASAQVSDAQTQVTNLISLAEIATQTAAISVRQARLAVSQTAVTAPVTGVVIQVASVGTVLAPGATLAKVRVPSESVTTWLSQADAQNICTGDAATVTADWMADSRSGEIATIATSAEIPPTSHASSDLHLTRAIRVTITVDDPGDLPPGGPADLSLSTCRSER